MEKQIIYNTNSNKFTKTMVNGYKIDGVQQKQSDLPNELRLLNVIDNTTPPTYDNVTQFLTPNYVIDIPNGEYRLEYTITDKTAEQIQQETIASVNWSGLRKDLNMTTAFYQKALQFGTPNLFTVVFNSIINQFLTDLEPSLRALANQLQTDGHISAVDIAYVNTILGDNNVPFSL